MKLINLFFYFSCSIQTLYVMKSPSEQNSFPMLKRIKYMIRETPFDKEFLATLVGGFVLSYLPRIVPQDNRFAVLKKSNLSFFPLSLALFYLKDSWHIIELKKIKDPLEALRSIKTAWHFLDLPSEQQQNIMNIKHPTLEKKKDWILENLNMEDKTKIIRLLKEPEDVYLPDAPKQMTAEEMKAEKIKQYALQMENYEEFIKIKTAFLALPPEEQAAVFDEIKSDFKNAGLIIDQLIKEKTEKKAISILLKMKDARKTAMITRHLEFWGHINLEMRDEDKETFNKIRIERKNIADIEFAAVSDRTISH